MKKGNTLIIIGIIFILSSLVLLVYNLSLNSRAKIEGNDILPVVKEVIDKNKNKEIDPDLIEKEEFPDYYYDPNISMPTTTIKGKKYVGMLYIDAINIELPVQDGWKSSNRLPSRYYGSAYLNNMVICAHNFSDHFGKLRKLKIGDIVEFQDIDGNLFRYKVGEVIIIKGTNVEEMKNSEWDLTLFTCDYNNTQRITIRCELIK